jgi:hypothetical protein
MADRIEQLSRDVGELLALVRIAFGTGACVPTQPARSATPAAQAASLK